MSDKSLKLLLRECISILSVLSNPRRQVATFGEGGYIGKSWRGRRGRGTGGRRKEEERGRGGVGEKRGERGSEGRGR